MQCNVKSLILIFNIILITLLFIVVFIHSFIHLICIMHWARKLRNRYKYLTRLVTTSRIPSCLPRSLILFISSLDLLIHGFTCCGKRVLDLALCSGVQLLGLLTECLSQILDPFVQSVSTSTFLVEVNPASEALILQ